MSDEDAELDTIKTVLGAFKALEDEAAQQRVLTYVCTRLGLSVQHKLITKGKHDPSTENGAGGGAGGGGSNYSTIDQLFEVAAPSSGSDRALVAGYWFQVCKGGESFTGAEVNGALKQIGHELANVSATFRDHMNKKPAMIIQAGKVGTLHKKYKLTGAGIKAVETAINKAAE